MVYKFFPKNNYEDFSSGRVIFHKSGYPNFPVRLAGEIFHQCLEHLNKKENIIIYDPCCGSAYLLTILGFLFNNKITEIYASDISEESIGLAENNLSLLSFHGLKKRESSIIELINKYKKQTHINALNSLKNILVYLKQEIIYNTFIANILNEDELKNKKFHADIIITDLPYNDLVSWSEEISNPIDILLETIDPVINTNTIIAIIHNKNQKISNKKYKRLNKFKVGHRIVEILKLE
jgi:hypothetical protein